MMKRRWSNNGGFALRMLEESNSEVTSSSAGLIMSPSIALSPNSLGSPEYGDLDLWSYEDNPLHSGHGHGGGTNGHHHHTNGGLGATNLNGIHNLHHGNGAAVQNPNSHLLHGASLINGVGAAHINRLAQGMVNELLAANGGSGLGLGVDIMANGGVGAVKPNTNLTSSRSSTSPSIGKLNIFLKRVIRSEVSRIMHLYSEVIYASIMTTQNENSKSHFINHGEIIQVLRN